MAKFKVGEKARVIPGPNMKPLAKTLVGKECTVVELISTPWFATNSHEQWYAVVIPGFASPTRDGEWLSPESYLEKRLPPGWETTTWDECLWRPKETKTLRVKITADTTKYEHELKEYQREILERLTLGNTYYEFPRRIGKRWRP